MKTMKENPERYKEGNLVESMTNDPFLGLVKGHKYKILTDHGDKISIEVPNSILACFVPKYLFKPIFNTRIDLSKKCGCDIVNLMISGCKCGGT